MTTTGPGQVRAFRRERLGRELRRRRGLRATSGPTRVCARGRRAPTRRAGDTDWVHGGRVIEALVAVGIGIVTFTGVVYSLLFLVVQFGTTTFTPRLNLFRDAPIVWHAFG